MQVSEVIEVNKRDERSDSERGVASDSERSDSEVTNRKPQKQRYGAIIFDLTCEYVLMVKGREHGKWGLPKGHENGQESKLEAAVREVYEETSIDINKYEIMKSVQCLNVHFFVVRVPRGIKYTPLDKREVEEISFFHISQLDNLDLNASAKNFRKYYNNIVTDIISNDSRKWCKEKTERMRLCDIKKCSFLPKYMLKVK